MNSFSTKFGALFGLVIIATTSIAQQATPAQRGKYPIKETYGTMHLSAALGSFKLMDGEGRVEVNFTGSLMISQLTGGTVNMSGKFEKQYDDRGRILYYGTGKAIITGKFRGIQWFGKNMNLVWFGTGRARLAGEYDKKLETGKLWFDDPTKVIKWPAQGTFDYQLPRAKAPKPVVPTRKPGVTLMPGG